MKSKKKHSAFYESFLSRYHYLIIFF
uniref:Uncharacterized protein n=1 Tax=Heterorhabditis bacteriophora TaxID=37862 RepID=A0A1I7X564_HETBA